MHGTQKSGIQPLLQRGGHRGVLGDTHLGSRELQGQGSTWHSCPKQGMPWGADGAARAPPESFPPAIPEQTLQLARKQRFLMMGNVRAAEPAVLLPPSPAGILGKHSRSSTGSGFVASGQGSELEFTPNSQHMPSAPALQPPSRGGQTPQGWPEPRPASCLTHVHLQLWAMHLKFHPDLFGPGREISTVNQYLREKILAFSRPVLLRNSCS